MYWGENMRVKSRKIQGENEELNSLVEKLCTNVKELYYYNEEIEKKRSHLNNMEKEISDLELKARHVTVSINKLQAKIAHQN